MKKLRWWMDGGFWDVDVSTPLTIDGVARPVPGDPLPLGLSRGTKLSRHKQIDFFQRFMAAPFVPSFSNGISFQRILPIPLPSVARDTWCATVLGQFNLHKFVTSLRRDGIRKESDSSYLSGVWRHLSDKQLYALSFCSEWLLTTEDTLLLSLEPRSDMEIPRKRALLHHKFPSHNLILEAASPALFVDHLGNYWDVPHTFSMDLSSVASDSGASCRFCIKHTTGSPKLCEGLPLSPVPPSLLPGLCAKCDVSFRKKIDIWRSEAPKKHMGQPYDLLLSNPHVSAAAVLGTVVTASLGDNSVRAHTKGALFGFQARGESSSLSADPYASVSFSAQHGNFRKHFLDLSRFYSHVDIPLGPNFLVGASRVAFDLFNSQVPSMEAVQAVCPSVSLSFQQQIAGPLSFRIDAEVSPDLKKDRVFSLKDPVFAVEYALQVVGSAKAVAWYSLKQREFMVELRFFET